MLFDNFCFDNPRLQKKKCVFSLLWPTETCFGEDSEIKRDVDSASSVMETDHLLI